MKNEVRFKNFKIDSVVEEQPKRLVISGWAARFGNRDSYGDIIMPGAFTKTIAERGSRIAFCYQHELDEPIGKIQLLEERPEGLWIEVMLSASEDDIQTKVKEGILQEMSIGYRTLSCTEEMQDGETTYRLTEIKLYEVSLVTIAANEMAVIVGMKSEEKKNYFDQQFDRLIASERSNAKRYELQKLKTSIMTLLSEEPPSSTQKTEPSEFEKIAKEEIKQLLLS